MEVVFQAAVTRWRRAALPIGQASLAAGLAWLVATKLIGHDRPFFAPVAAVISLGVSHNQRRRRAAELMLGVVLGVIVGDLLIAVIGSGAWQISLVVALAMSMAVLIDSGPVIVAQAGASAVLVATLLPGAGLPRALDALVGAVIGLMVAALLPADPLSPARRTIHVLLAELAATLGAVAAALRAHDDAALLAALSRVRETQPQVDELRSAIRAGEEITSMAPLRRPRRAELQRLDGAAVGADYALRNTRVLARRALAALRSGERLPPVLPDRLDELARAIRSLAGKLGSGLDPAGARAVLIGIAAGLGEPLLAGTGFSGRVVVAQLRSVLLDLLQATGMPRADAISTLPPLSGP
jgi:uncharacterized membrane protein YgaE (UPF0421/DUF939 family)